MKRKKQGGIESIKRKYGALFIAPWVFGVALFVIVPVLTFFRSQIAIATCNSSQKSNDL